MIAKVTESPASASVAARTTTFWTFSAMVGVALDGEGRVLVVDVGDRHGDRLDRRVGGVGGRRSLRLPTMYSLFAPSSPGFSKFAPLADLKRRVLDEISKSSSSAPPVIA